MRFNNKVALVTGGASGIGLATAQRLSKDGATVYIGDLNDEEGQRVAQQINGSFVRLDVSQEQSWKEAISAIKEKSGRLDMLVNNAGIACAGTLEEETVEQFNRVLQINLVGVFLGCQAAVPLMAENSGGAIVNVSSIFGLVSDQLTIAYSASKGGVCAMTKAIALDCASRGTGVRVNSIHPGFVATPMVANAVNSIPPDVAEAYGARTVGQTPLGMAEPQDIADVIAFMLSDDARYMTGSEVVADGGFTAR
jgi:3(or 17)beta-hydroxysteroid dehydrogenase